MTVAKWNTVLALGCCASLFVLAACGAQGTEASSSEDTVSAPQESVDELPNFETFSKDLSIVQREVAAIPSAPPVNARDLKVSAKVDRTNGMYSIGDNVVISATTNKDAYLWIVNVHDDGKMEMLFPNKYSPQNRLSANSEITLPLAGSNYAFRVGGSPGADLIQVYATLTEEPPLAAMSRDTTAFSKGMGELEIDARSLAKDLSIVVERVNCGVSKDLSIVSNGTPDVAGGDADRAAVENISFEELCGGTTPPSQERRQPGTQAERPTADWRNVGFASSSVKLLIVK